MQQVQTTSPVVVPDLSGVREMVGGFLPSQPVFFDTETTGYEGSDLRTDRPVALQFSQGETVYIIDVRRAAERGRISIGKALKPLFDGDYLVVGHNLKFDAEVLLTHFGVLPLKVWDTMLCEQVLHGLGLSDGKRQKPPVGFGLKDAAERRGLSVSKDTRGSFKNMHETPAWYEPFSAEQLSYMARDVEILRPIFQSQYEALGEDEMNLPYGKPLWDCFNLEMEVLPALAHTEVSGLGIDWTTWMGIIEEKKQEADVLREEVVRTFQAAVMEKRQETISTQMEQVWAWEQARDHRIEELKQQYESGRYLEDFQPMKWGEYKIVQVQRWREENPCPKKPKEGSAVFNLNSPAQLLEAFAELGIPAEDTTEDTLSDLAEEYPVIGKLVEYRKAAKFVQSFGESLQYSVSSADSRLHADFMQIGASTNRMSCTRPNLQQFPARSETGKKLRSCVRAAPGNKVLTADFGSQELCIIADLSEDETMLRLFDEGADLHSATARMMFGLADDVNPKQYEIAPGVSSRDAAKTINYGLAYGQTEWGLAHTLGIEPTRARDLIERWYTPYQGVKRYFEERKAQIFRGELYSVTEHGWVRHYEPLPPEPVKPYRATKEAYRAWKDVHREWERKKRKLENKLMNTPIQGTGAGITKRALADFFTVVRSYNERAIPVKIIAVVHDEIVVESPEAYAEEVARKLAECMDNAMRSFLRRVTFPRSEVHIGDFWSH